MRRLALLLVSFAVGALLGDAPSTSSRRHQGGRGNAAAIAFLSLPDAALFRGREAPAPRARPASPASPSWDDPGPQLAAVNILGDVIHNFIDGVLIAASYLVSPTLGLGTTFAVLLHEIPQELGDFGILIHSGLTVRQAVIFNLASASVSVSGPSPLSRGCRVQVRHNRADSSDGGGVVHIAAADLIRSSSMTGVVAGSSPRSASCCWAWQSWESWQSESEPASRCAAGPARDLKRLTNLVAAEARYAACGEWPSAFEVRGVRSASCAVDSDSRSSSSRRTAWRATPRRGTRAPLGPHGGPGRGQLRERAGVVSEEQSR